MGCKTTIRRPVFGPLIARYSVDEDLPGCGSGGIHWECATDFNFGMLQGSLTGLCSGADYGCPEGVAETWLNFDPFDRTNSTCLATWSMDLETEAAMALGRFVDGWGDRRAETRGTQACLCSSVAVSFPHALSAEYI